MIHTYKTVKMALKGISIWKELSVNLNKTKDTNKDKLIEEYNSIKESLPYLVSVGALPQIISTVFIGITLSALLMYFIYDASFYYFISSTIMIFLTDACTLYWNRKVMKLNNHLNELHKEIESLMFVDFIAKTIKKSTEVEPQEKPSKEYIH